jgi:oxidase EvaA
MLISSSSKGFALHKFDEILNWLTALKCKYELELNYISLFDIEDWVISDEVIKNIDNRFFEVIAAQVSISNREVKNWSQPLVRPLQQGIIAFILKDINGVTHFLVQAKLECGNFDILEFAPTVQCITDSYKNESDVPFLAYILNATSDMVIFDTLQSEEGGRFYKEQNRNVIIKADDSFSVEVPENYCWMTLNQLNTFLKFNNYLNIQARSIISAINFIKDEDTI